MTHQTTLPARMNVGGTRPLAIDYSDAAGEASSVSIPLIVESEVSSTAQPVTVGVPWSRGILRDDSVVSLIDPSGQHVPLQTTPLAHWPDRSVKWLLLDFALRPAVAGQGVWTLASGRKEPPARAGADTAVVIAEAERHLVVNTGSASFTLDREFLAPVLQVEIDGKLILDPTQTQTALTDERGRSRRPLIERYEFEAKGPVRATVRVEGRIEGRHRQSLRFLARLSFFAGSSLARVELTLHNPRRARHRGGLWDLGDPGSILFRDLSLQLGLGGSGSREIRWTAEPTGRQETTVAAPFEIYQDSSGGENWASRNHVNRHGQVPCRFRGFRVRRGGEISDGLRASPVVAVRGPAGTVMAAIPEFWQNFPKAIDTDRGTLNIRLFPRQFGDLFELQGGEQKTHTVWLYFGPADRSDIDSLRWVHRPARVHCRPQWYAETGTIPYLLPGVGDAADRYEFYLSGVVQGASSLFARRELIDEYGWRNYGEVYADHEGEHYTGEPPVISHYNNQYDLVFGTLLQWIRSGDARWFDLADPLSRHVVDIDIYHTDGDKVAYNGGLFWHTNHYQDARTSTHRAYSRQNFRPGDPFGGGGPGSNHNYSIGLLHYYFLTGDTSARDAVIGLSDWVVNMEDGEQTIFGVLEPSDTGNATYPGEPNYQGPCRGAGNSINCLIDGWLLTGRPSYLDKAEVIIRRVSHPDDDILGRDLLNVEPRWSYTVFLSAVARYLAAKAEAGRLDFMYAYSRAVLLHYAAWMVDHERPYFDQVEKLEFPNETWAAQEFRKANVLRLAAAHADEPLRSAALRRGDELAERAWQDLLRFPSRHSTRAVALLLIEGMRDAFFRREIAATAPRPDRQYDFGVPETFVPQKEKVLAQLRSPGSLLAALVRLGNPKNWRRIRLRGHAYWAGY